MTRRKTTARAMGIASLLFGTAVAFDLTPDRGQLGDSKGYGMDYFGFSVFNVGKTNWGPLSTCGIPWSSQQWRGYDGKRIGTVSTKYNAHPVDGDSITNGWFPPAPQGIGQTASCSGSGLSRGWEDTYTATQLAPDSLSTGSGFWPSYHIRVDPSFAYPDENPTNNEIWMTMTWKDVRWFPSENLDVAPLARTLTPGDSVFLGVYDTLYSEGNITLTGTSSTQLWSQILEDGNEKYGYQARRMRISLTGGAKNKYVIKNGSRVTAEFLGQNRY